MNQFLSSLAGNIGANQAQTAIDKNLYQKPDNISLFENLYQKLCDIHKDLDTVARYFEHLSEPAIDENIVLQQEKRIELKTHGRQHNAILCSSNLQIRVKPPKSQSFVLATNAGWFALDMKEGTELWLDSGNDATILYRCSNRPLGGNTL